jgi:hypothetical protein
MPFYAKKHFLQILCIARGMTEVIHIFSRNFTFVITWNIYLMSMLMQTLPVLVFFKLKAVHWAAFGRMLWSTTLWSYCGNPPSWIVCVTRRQNVCNDLTPCAQHRKPLSIIHTIFLPWLLQLSAILYFPSSAILYFCSELHLVRCLIRLLSAVLELPRLRDGFLVH